jgi:hypothetical protein
VQAILRLVPDRRVRAVEDVLRDLLSVVRRQAVQDDRLVVRTLYEVRVDAVTGEVA